MSVRIIIGDALEQLRLLPDGRFKKGERRSPATEFKPGEHWRKPQAFREAACSAASALTIRITLMAAAQSGSGCILALRVAPSWPPCYVAMNTDAADAGVEAAEVAPFTRITLNRGQAIHRFASTPITR